MKKHEVLANAVHFDDEGIALAVIMLQSAVGKVRRTFWKSQLENWLYEVANNYGVMYVGFIYHNPTIENLLELLALNYCNCNLMKVLKDNEEFEVFQDRIEFLNHTLERVLGKPVYLTTSLEHLRRQYN